MSSAALDDPLRDTPEVRRDWRALPWRRRAFVLGQLWVVNVGLAVLVASIYLSHAPPTSAPRALLFLYAGLVSCAASVSLVPGVLVLLLSLVLRGPRLLGTVAALAWTVSLLLLFVDTQLYGIFRYHFNGMVWNVITTPGAEDAVHVSSAELALVAAGTVVLYLAEFVCFRALAAREVARGPHASPVARLARPRTWWALVFAPCILLAAGDYAYADLMRDRQVLGLARLYPVYPRVTVKAVATRYFGYAIEDLPEVELATEGILLDYPTAPPTIDPHGPRPNVLILIVDSLRSDMLAPETMPETWRFSRDARVFKDHFSGGNATRFGLFGVIYGLHGSYWKPIYQEQHSPVLVDALLELGYDIRILSSASMSYPEFRSTAWVRIESRVEDRLPGEREGGRDDGVVTRFESWMAERDGAAAPFFSLVLLDAPHQKYSFPAEHAVFEPWAEDISYLKMASASAADAAPVFNRYKNSVHYADATVGELLATLDRHGELDDTLVMITGDHGEEFFENGFFGHTSNFTRAQVQVPFVLRGPGVTPGEEAAPTSHIDVPATVLELLGADPARRADWTLGLNLLEPSPDRRRVVAGWDELGLEAVNGEMLVIPMATYRGGGIDVYDAHWRLADDASAVLRNEGAALGRLALECRRYLR